MRLSNMKVFNIKPEKKPRIKRLSNGEFVSESYCAMGGEIVERYVARIWFNEVSTGVITLSAEVVNEI